MRPSIVFSTLSTLEQARAVKIKEEKYLSSRRLGYGMRKQQTVDFWAVPEIELPNEYMEAISDLKKGNAGPVMDDGEWSILYLQDVLIQVLTIAKP